MAPKKEERKIAVIAVDETAAMRSIGEKLTGMIEIDASQLAVSINLFLTQMDEVMTKTPETVGKFQLAEVEVSAEITTKGQVVLWGVGGEVGAGGGIKFVFRKGQVTSTQ